MSDPLRTLIFGSPLPSTELAETRLDKKRALAALSPDALASVAYANQEIYLGLIVAGAAGLAHSWQIALVITSLLALLSFSYVQTIGAYPAGGGSYTVARENLGDTAGLVAAAALLIDYLLNAAVSLTAGVAALASAFPALWAYRVALALALLLLITLLNLRGAHEVGTVMTLPVYLFLVVYLGMIAWGLVVAVQQGPGTAAAAPAGSGAVLVPVTLALLLRTFASGSTALTGVEAISNAVPIFKPPTTRNAQITMLVMALLLGTLFMGTIGLTQYLGVLAGPDETILSALAHRLVGYGGLYYLVQLATLLVLVVAANTSFTGFPRMSSLMAQDGFLPRQLRVLGDRLVFSNGILVLAALAGLLIILFQGDTHLLIPLFAVGAFLAFTLSQAGMVRHWWQMRGPGWEVKMLLNGLGALATAVALLVIGSSKFRSGAWIVILLIPMLVVLFRRVRGHYAHVGRELSLAGAVPQITSAGPIRIIVPVAGVHRGVVAALNYACSICGDVTAVFVELEPESGVQLAEKWYGYGLEQAARLVIVSSPYRSLIGPFLAEVDRQDAAHPDAPPAMILIPEFVPAHAWQFLLHNQTALLLKWALIYRRRRFGKARAVIDVPFHLEP